MGGKRDRSGAEWLGLWAGIGIFFVWQFINSLVRLSSGSGAMKNKFSVLAKDEYLGFLLLQNVFVGGAYLILSIAFLILIYPFFRTFFMRGSAKPWVHLVSGFAGACLIHGFACLRLADTRPYFLDEAKFGHWYYQLLGLVPQVAQEAVYFGLFTIFPLLVLGFAITFYFVKGGRVIKGFVILTVAAAGTWGLQAKVREVGSKTAAESEGFNFVIIGSDSLRGDRLGYSGYRPQRTDGPARHGVSPNIDRLAATSAVFERCYVPIASTLESGTSLMSSSYPHTHGFRHMYPSRDQVEAMEGKVESLAGILAEKGYDTAAFGDWCAGYYDLVPLGFEHVAVSSFDNFKVYMSQAVVMAHFVVPLIFRSCIGLRTFSTAKVICAICDA